MTSNASAQCVVLLWLLVLSGCATAPPSSTATWTPMGSGLAPPMASDLRWYGACFRMPFDAAGQPVWATDLVLADRVAAPLLKAYAQEIPLWRFHRRAAADLAGHQFTLLVYARPAIYAALRAQIDAAPTVQMLRAAGRLGTIAHDCRSSAQAPLLEATSDPGWDPALQRAWPYFIMGVSASWLALIQEFSAEVSPEETDLLGAYAKVDARITALWGAQGQHAFLHHLSGVYGYHPLKIESWMNF